MSATYNIQATSSLVRNHIRILSVISFVVRCTTALNLTLYARLPLFDRSPEIQLLPLSFILRWDAFHYAHIAEKGYIHEYEWAFFPGTPYVMRIAGAVLHALKGLDLPRIYLPTCCVTPNDLLQGCALAALACGSATTLYRLTLHHLESPYIALLASHLSLLPTSPATLHFAAYSEPFFTYLSYKGEQ